MCINAFARESLSINSRRATVAEHIGKIFERERDDLPPRAVWLPHVEHARFGLEVDQLLKNDALGGWKRRDVDSKLVFVAHASNARSAASLVGLGHERKSYL